MTLRSITRQVRTQATSDGAGVRLERSIGTAALDHVDPFLLFDEFRSESGADYVAGFPDHPHRGFETVTYMLAGHMHHRDHTGAEGHLGPGSVQWMTAGRGIVHSEMPEQEEGLLWGFQLWVNLPARAKMTEPRYQDIPADAVPLVERDGLRVKVLAGEYGGARGPVDGVPTDPVYLDVELDEGAVFEAPISSERNALLYPIEGGPLLVPTDGDDAKSLARGSLAVLGDGEGLRVHAEHRARFLVIAGRPIGEPIARHGPFVMNTHEEIVQAVHDFQSGRFLHEA